MKPEDLKNYGLIFIILLWVATILSATANILLPIVMVALIGYGVYWAYKKFFRKEEINLETAAYLLGLLVMVWVLNAINFVLWVALLVTVIYGVYLIYDYEKNQGRFTDER